MERRAAPGMRFIACCDLHSTWAALKPIRSYDDLESGISTLTLTPFDSVRPTLQRQTSLPPKRYPRVLRHLRYTFLTVYRRLFTAVFIANMIPLFIILHPFQGNNTNRINPNTLATAASTNLLVAILIRQDIIVNAIFRTAWLVPWQLPLRIRRVVARCYCYGGIHSGAAIAGTAWWTAFSILLTLNFVKDGLFTMPIVVTTFAILGLLVAILVLAYPSLRERWHNTFELTHRFLGWASILLFWIQLILLTSHETNTGSSSAHNTIMHALLHTPTFWNLSIITLLLAYPWLRLRKWEFTPEVLSQHAIRLRFTNPVHKFSCLSISKDPLREWHPFATFPSTLTPNKTGENSLIISSAGDWTHSIISLAQTLQNRTTHLPTTSETPEKHTETPKMSFYIKGHPRSGVLSLSCLFPRAILLTTGSGIGPALSSLLDRPPAQSIRLVWSTRSPIKTYGYELYRQVLETDPEAVIIDTDQMGRPDLVDVACRLWKDMGDGKGAEVVFVLSNKGVTKKVVRGLETRGVPAFGPVWDS
ncbi:hypothetical protein P280DRAFT_496264 [Massarina eburnea CBS 473.64]|uniref:Integral membrane protein TmpA n=1 Tax=Massarina eburnea CBS 473.64 TaxID=1395130 RepID=A0A6A6SB84_9PLEO|nr:hypothetical protein P280DRAFT_496264 [Massarina eburnea CBS 473.64]